MSKGINKEPRLIVKLFDKIAEDHPDFKQAYQACRPS